MKITGIWAALGVLLSCVSARADGGSVVVYTPIKASAVTDLTSEFTKATGIKTEVVQLNTGTILRRVRAEATHPRGDVVWSLGGAELQTSAALLEPYTSKEADQVAPAFRVPGLWTPFSAVAAVLVVNTKLVQPADYPNSWTDLTLPRWHGKLASTRADQSGSAFQELATVLVAHGDSDAGWELYGKILANFAYVDSTGEVARVVNDGELPVGITLEDNALDYLHGGGPVAIVYPKDGTSVIPDGMAMIKGAPHPQEGQRFIDWMLGPEAQAYVVKSIGRRSVRTDITQTATGARPLQEVQRVEYDFFRIGANSAGWIAHWTKLAKAAQ